MMRQKKRKGGVLVMFAISMVVIIACSGLAVDVGRMYVTRTEAQSFVDSLALAKAAEYIGERDENSGDVWKRYNFNTESFTNYEVGYSSSLGGTYSTEKPESGNVYVRATATVDVPLLLLRVLVPDDFGTVRATAVAGVERLTSAGEGTFPYAIRTPPSGPSGFVLDVPYTFRWGNNVSKDLEDAWKYVIANIPDAGLDAQLDATAEVLRGGNPFIGKNPPNINEWCAGDATREFLMGLLGTGTSFDTVSGDLFSWNGGFFSGGTNTIVAAMAFGYQDQLVEEGDTISVATGVRQATVNELKWVVSHDTDPTSVTKATYLADPTGNGFRVIEVATVVFDTAYLKPGSGAVATVAAIEAFLLQPSGSYGNPQSNWCATYYGGILAGSEGPIDQPSGVWVVKLIS